MYNKRKLIMSSLSTNPTHDEVDKYVSTATEADLKDKYNKIGQSMMGVVHPTDKYLKSKIEERFPYLKTNGGRRSSKKNPTARRRRSSKARKSRKVRKSRTTRRR